MAKRKKESKQSTPSTLIAEKDVYFMGPKGGMRVQVRQRTPQSPFIRLTKWREGQRGSDFYINQENHWLKMKRYIDSDFVPYLGWGGFSTPEADVGGFISVEDHKRAMKKLERDNKKKSTKLMEMEKTIARSRSGIRRKLEERYKIAISDHKRTLAEFKKMIDANVTEQMIHPFLRENYWIFGTFYIGKTNEPKIGFKNKGDFMLLKENGYVDLIELKRPGDAVFTKRGRPSSETNDAISQMITYLHKCDVFYHQHFMELEINALKPQGFIIIGRRDNPSPDDGATIQAGPHRSMTEENLQIHNAYLSNITLMTFDQLYENARQTIHRFEGKAKSS